MEQTLGYKSDNDREAWGKAPRYYVRISPLLYEYIASKFPVIPKNDTSFNERIRLVSNESKSEIILVFRLDEDEKKSAMVKNGWAGDPYRPGDYYILAKDSSQAHRFFYWIMKERNKILDTKHCLDII